VRDLHDRTHRAIAFVALPASVGLFVLARPVIAASFEHGAFGPEGVTRATAALRMLCLAILPAGAVEGLALATAITSWGSLVLLIPRLGKRLALPPSTTRFLAPLVRMGLATAACAGRGPGGGARGSRGPWKGTCAAPSHHRGGGALCVRGPGAGRARSKGRAAALPAPRVISTGLPRLIHKFFHGFCTRSFGEAYRVPFPRA
jgi:hypothetical protein